jgi:hypothetical protein
MQVASGPVPERQHGLRRQAVQRPARAQGPSLCVDREALVGFVALGAGKAGRRRAGEFDLPLLEEADAQSKPDIAEEAPAGRGGLSTASTSR